MAPPRRPQLTSPEPGWVIEITDDQSRTLVDVNTDVSYHSRCGAAAECDHVYRNNGGFSQEDGDSATSQWPATILEIGLGTGLSMLRTLDHAVANDCPLRYISVEVAPLKTETLRQLDLGRGLRHPELVEEYLRLYEEHIEPLRTVEGDAADKQELRLGEQHPLPRVNWTPSVNRHVEIIVGNAVDFLAREDVLVDTVYLDAFDPKTSPELWTVGFLQTLAEKIRPGGRLVTYCVASEIRRRMESAGFSVQRVPGPPGGKREVMIALRSAAD
ncbi:MAG: tRNA (5-methylaminomethyl-2-thiouridine)(34)-methyltransferase MnmD [Rhodopirellula sp. JB053]|uniref:tRNA (5-methylaminomethyl-2-thiouridine)(34)-methyltransferase MnmD n=1 Tax=Rhodopirellula sp. JB044 TaxID=3342844 RepID=UPI00370A4B3D